MSRPSGLVRWLVALVVLAVAVDGALPAWGQAPIPPRPGPWSFEVTPYPVGHGRSIVQ
jgi:hypothetical protein